MKNIKIKFACFFLFFISVFSLSSQVVNIYDESNLLTQEEISLLTKDAEEVSKEYNIAVYVTVISDMADYGYNNIESFTEFWFDKENLGWPETKDTIMLCLTMADRSYDLFAHGNKGNYAFTDYGKGRIIDNNVLPFLKSGNYFMAFKSYISVLPEYLQAYEQGTPIDIPPKEPHVPNPFKDGIFAFLISLFPGLTSCARQKRKLNNIKPATNANSYIIDDALNLSIQNDFFLRTETHKEYISTTSSSGGGSHGGTTISSHGSSHSSGHF